MVQPQHASDCALHNAPALPPGPCDCLDCSFTPSGDWFVFDATGATLVRGFRTKAQALAWMWRRTVEGA